MNIKALVLDADGVLIEPLKFADYLKREYPAIAEQSREFFLGVFQQCIVGQADLRAVLPPYLEKWDWPHSLDAFVDRWFEEENAVDERLIAVVRAVRESGIPCYVATNQERYRVSYMREQMGFDAHFDAVFSSADIGFKKPDVDFYRAVMTRIGLSGENILFWDDNQKNVDGAVACGWQGRLYVGFEDFADKLRGLLGAEKLPKR